MNVNQTPKIPEEESISHDICRRATSCRQTMPATFVVLGLCGWCTGVQSSARGTPVTEGGEQ
jgi:hypothetical protein